jgi:hypothetical protein
MLEPEGRSGSTLPARPCSDPLALLPGYSCSPMWMDALCLALSPLALVFEGVPFPPPCTCPDPLALMPRVFPLR